MTEVTLVINKGNTTRHCDTYSVNIFQAKIVRLLYLKICSCAILQVILTSVGWKWIHIYI